MTDEWTLDEFEQALEYLDAKAAVESAAHRKAQSDNPPNARRKR